SLDAVVPSANRHGGAAVMVPRPVRSEPQQVLRLRGCDGLFSRRTPTAADRARLTVSLVASHIASTGPSLRVIVLSRPALRVPATRPRIGAAITDSSLTGATPSTGRSAGG